MFDYWLCISSNIHLCCILAIHIVAEIILTSKMLKNTEAGKRAREKKRLHISIRHTNSIIFDYYHLSISTKSIITRPLLGFE